MRKSLYDFCVEMNRPHLLEQWVNERNGAETPRSVSYGSKKKVWWRCGSGHEWQAMVKSRVSGTGCPICNNRVVQKGENDLGTVHPELAAQWDHKKNGSLKPTDVTAGSRRRVWWICGKGHEWQATVASRRSMGVGCPVCAGKMVVPGENDLLSAFPDIAGQWHTLKNGAVRPDRISPYSNRRVWWRCGLGHEWEAPVAARTAQNVGCPYCAGRVALAGFNDLATAVPAVAAQWHPSLNGTATPQEVLPGSHKKVWWQCSEGHAWKAVVYSRTGARKCGCPVCAGKVREERQRRYADMLADPEARRKERAVPQMRESGGPNDNTC